MRHVEAERVSQHFGRVIKVPVEDGLPDAWLLIGSSPLQYGRKDLHRYVQGGKDLCRIGRRSVVPVTEPEVAPQGEIPKVAPRCHDGKKFLS
jgi:hypothetical protein